MIIQQEICYFICINKFFGIYFSGQASTSILQQINCVRKLEEYDGTILFLLLKSSERLF